MDKFLLVNRARVAVEKAELTWKQYEQTKKPVAAKSQSKSEEKAEANCIRRIAWKLAKAKKKSVGLPVAPKSAYSLYAAEMMAKEAKESDSAEKKTLAHFQGILKRVAESWKALPDEQKESYKATAPEFEEL